MSIISKLATSVRAVVGGATPAGAKPGQSTRKGGRSPKPRPNKAHEMKMSGDYILIRRTPRQKVCNGCKGEFDSSVRHVIRHHCAIPFPQRDQSTGEIFYKTGRADNHHFHPSKWCVLRSTHHKSFSGNIKLDPTLPYNAITRTECATGSLGIIQ